MENNQTGQAETAAGKAQPDHVAGSSESQTKAKTTPLPAEGRQQTDREEGEMNNGETGVPPTKE